MSEPLKNKEESGGIKALKDALKTTAFLLKIAMILLVLAFLFSGMKNLKQYEKAVVLRFGAEHGKVKDKAGLNFALPFPIDQVLVVPAGRVPPVKSKTFMYQNVQMQEVAPFLKPGIDGYLMTADGNVVHCESTLNYKIDDVSNYLFNIQKGQMQNLLRNLLDSAVLKAMATQTLEEAWDKTGLIDESKKFLQQSLDELEVGVTVELVDIKLTVPRQIEEVRLDVTKARQQSARLKSETDTYINDVETLTESNLANILSKAKIERTRMLARAQTDLKTFEDLIDDYRKDPEQVKAMLLRDAMMEISSGLDEVFMFDSKKSRELRLIVPRKPIDTKVKDAE